MITTILLIIGVIFYHLDVKALAFIFPTIAFDTVMIFFIFAYFSTKVEKEK